MDKEAKTQSDKLLQQIIHAIRADQGSISFADYMERALYTPVLGYYSGDAPKFGARGDFVTAPEISPLFSHCIARQYAQIAASIPQADILEIGAGSGQMACDMLLFLGHQHQLPERYFILEKSTNLQQRQQQKLAALCPQYQDRVQWIDKLPPSGFKGMIIANEVVDAMPVQRFQIVDGKGYELRVVEDQGQLQERAFPWDHPALQRLQALAQSQHWPNPYNSEINLYLPTWMQDLSACLTQGLLLIIDYGFAASEYYHPDRSMGTLMCHYQHKAHTDPFLYPGMQDISIHVDFSALAEAADSCGLECLGYTHQAAFLLGCGIGDRSDHDAKNSDDNLKEREHILQQHALQQLLSPSEMGELFKVIAFGCGIDIPLRGFDWLDKQHLL